MAKKPSKGPFQAEERDLEKKLSMIEEFLPKVSRMGSAFPVPWDIPGNLGQHGMLHQEHADIQKNLQRRGATYSVENHKLTHYRTFPGHAMLRGEIATNQETGDSHASGA